MIRFKKHDLIREKEIGCCDVLFCRNVIIYFSREQQKDLYLKFYSGLKGYGYLVTGKSETLVGEAANLFTTVNSREKIYQKIPSAT
jgi:chemotaxis protein methyltransferase CheR